MLLADLPCYEKPRFSMYCADCVCETCLFRWSMRCPHGSCYDDLRAKELPYDREHPGKVRNAWSNWNRPGEQAHWCRGGVYGRRWTACLRERKIYPRQKQSQRSQHSPLQQHLRGKARNRKRFRSRNQKKVNSCCFRYVAGMMLGGWVRIPLSPP